MSAGDTLSNEGSTKPATRRWPGQPARAPALVHGRYDVSGPLDTAWDLHRAWPASRLIVLDDAGHGGTSMTEAVVEALNGFR